MKKSLLILSALLAAVHVNFLQAAPQECIGRLTFEQPPHFDWAVAFAELPIASEATVSDNITIPLDRWDYNRNTRVMVTEATTDRTYTAQASAFLPSKLAIKEALNEIEISKRRVNTIQKLLVQKKEMQARNEEIPGGLLNINETAIEDVKQTLRESEAKLEALKNYKIPAVYLEEKPYTAFTINQDTQRVFVWREPRAYMFYISNLFKPRDNPPATLEDAKKLLAAFSPRTLGTVPNQKGFCFPYGFISDSGKEIYQIKNSFRFSDQPNVVYTLNTGTDTYYLLTQPARQGLNTRVPKLSDPNKFTPMQTIDQTIALKNGNSLQLKGWKVSKKDPNPTNNQPVNFYVAYGDLTLKQANNPDLYIAVQIRSYGSDEKDARPNEAPPFETALARLIPILESIAVTLD